MVREAPSGAGGGPHHTGLAVVAAVAGVPSKGAQPSGSCLSDLGLSRGWVVWFGASSTRLTVTAGGAALRCVAGSCRISSAGCWMRSSSSRRTASGLCPRNTAPRRTSLAHVCNVHVVDCEWSSRSTLSILSSTRLGLRLLSAVACRWVRCEPEVRTRGEHAGHLRRQQQLARPGVVPRELPHD